MVTSICVTATNTVMVTTDTAMIMCIVTVTQTINFTPATTHTNKQTVVAMYMGKYTINFTLATTHSKYTAMNIQAKLTYTERPTGTFSLLLSL